MEERNDKAYKWNFENKVTRIKPDFNLQKVVS